MITVMHVCWGGGGGGGGGRVEGGLGDWKDPCPASLHVGIQ